MPNCNSFLAVVLDDASVGALGVVAEAIAASPSELLGARGIGFDPVDDESRHMTFVFFGEHLHLLPASELVAVHAAICEEVAALSISAAAPLAFRGFELFPPTKSNLVVACFEPSPPLLKLRHAVLQRIEKSGLSLPKSLIAMLEDDCAWMPHVTLGKIRASRAQIGGVSCSQATLHSLAPTASALPQGLTLLGKRPLRAWCNWDSALEFHKLAGTDMVEADSEDAQAIHLTADQAQDSPQTCSTCGSVSCSGNKTKQEALDSPQTLEVASALQTVQKSKEDTTDANPAEESMPEQSHGELGENASLDLWSSDLFVKCKVNAISSTRKRGRLLVEVQQSDSSACMQVVATQADVAVGQVWVVALPGALLEDGQQVKQAKIAGEWSEGALVRIIPGHASWPTSQSFEKEFKNNQPEDERASSDTSGNEGDHPASRDGEYCVLPGIKAVGDVRMSTVMERKQNGDLLHYVTGDATVVQYGKGRKIIAHICNDSGRWGKGFVMAVSGKWPEAARMYRQWHKAGVKEGFVLGAVQLIGLTPSLTLANMIGQNGIKTGSKGPPVRYEAIEEALMAVGAHAVSQGASIHMPRIGTGLAGGEWRIIENLLRNMLEWYSVHVYVYDYHA